MSTSFIIKIISFANLLSFDQDFLSLTRSMCILPVISIDLKKKPRANFRYTLGHPRHDCRDIPYAVLSARGYQNLFQSALFRYIPAIERLSNSVHYGAIYKTQLLSKQLNEQVCHVNVKASARSNRTLENV